MIMYDRKHVLLQFRTAAVVLLCTASPFLLLGPALHSRVVVAHAHCLAVWDVGQTA